MKVSNLQAIKRLWPHTLFARLTLIWILAIMAGHILNSAWISYVETHEERVMAAYYLNRDVANLVAILEREPTATRQEWVQRFQRENYEMRLQELPPGSLQIRRHFNDAIADLKTSLGGDYLITAGAPSDKKFDIALTLRLKDGTPLSVLAYKRRSPQSMLGGVVIAVQILCLAIFTWLAVRQATKPLAQLAQSANKLGASLSCEPLAETGPIEVARAAAAFNVMQKRITDHMAERMQILAAISHDLQTPITRMRLRADLLESNEQRNKLNGDLDTMQSLVEEGIAYARSAHSATETVCKIDLDALIDSLLFDYSDAQQNITLQGHYGQALMTRPNALRRVLTNLIDNAFSYSEQVTLSVSHTTTQLTLSIQDRGPGIPEAELENVLQPFYRLEGSRNRNTGGTGLGLAIAYQLSLALNGELSLRNRDGGGLEANLRMVI